MPDSQTNHLTQAINSIFADLGVNPPFIETILLCDGRYVGRKYKAGGYRVVWWAEKNVLEVLDEDGQSMRVVALEETLKISA